MTARRIITAALAAVIVVLCACGGDDADRNGAVVGGTRTTLPDLTLEPLVAGDAALDLGSLRGPAVVNLWATWCGPCRRELPAFQEVSTSYPDVRFIGVDIGEDTGAARAYLDELGVSFEQFADSDAALTDAIGAASLPVTLVVAPDGSIATEHLGPMSVDQLADAISELSAG